MKVEVKDILGTIIAISAFATAYIQYHEKKIERYEKEAKADTLQLLIQKQNEQNKKLADFFTALDSAEKLHAIADTAGN